VTVFLSFFFFPLFIYPGSFGFETFFPTGFFLPTTTPVRQPFQPLVRFCKSLGLGFFLGSNQTNPQESFSFLNPSPTLQSPHPTQVPQPNLIFSSTQCDFHPFLLNPGLEFEPRLFSFHEVLGVFPSSFFFDWPAHFFNLVLFCCSFLVAPRTQMGIKLTVDVTSLRNILGLSHPSQKEKAPRLFFSFFPRVKFPIHVPTILRDSPPFCVFHGCSSIDPYLGFHLSFPVHSLIFLVPCMFYFPRPLQGFAPPLEPPSAPHFSDDPPLSLFLLLPQNCLRVNLQTWSLFLIVPHPFFPKVRLF